MNRPGLLLALGCLLPAVAQAEVPFRPFPDPQVTLEQWTAYHAAVKDALGASVQERPAEQATMYFDEATRTQCIFTTEGNPAHAAWITRRIANRPGQGFFVEQVGYFAGFEERFASWFAAYQRENEQLRQQ